MMKEKKIFIIAVIIFIVIILVQTHLRPIRDMILSGAEQKAIPGIPTFSDIMSGKFQSGIEMWLKQNIGFRGTLVKTDNQINFSLFNEFSRSHPRKIILGKNKQLFEEPYIDAFNKKNITDASALEKQAAALRQLQDKLKARNVSFLLILSPSKATIYSEAIPDKYVLAHAAAIKDNYQILLPMLKQHGVNVLDGRELFLEMKKNGTPELFPSSGSHWSLYGGYLYGTKLIERMEQLLGRRLVHMPVKKLITSGEPIGLDKDIARLSNILFTRSLFTEYIYPETSPVALTGSYRPDMLLIGTSFCWNIIPYLEANRIFSRLDFYYYFNTDHSFPGKQRAPIDRNRINWNRDVFTKDIILIEINEIALKETGFGFLEAALHELNK
jgi:hypothetical protein